MCCGACPGWFSRRVLVTSCTLPAPGAFRGPLPRAEQRSSEPPSSIPPLHSCPTPPCGGSLQPSQATSTSGAYMSMHTQSGAAGPAGSTEGGSTQRQEAMHSLTPSPKRSTGSHPPARPVLRRPSVPLPFGGSSMSLVAHLHPPPWLSHHPGHPGSPSSCHHHVHSLGSH